MFNYNICSAILELLTPVDFYEEAESGLKPICMPQKPGKTYYDYQGAKMASFGFVGNTNDQNSNNGWPFTLREVTATIWRKNFCSKVLKTAEVLFWRPKGIGDVNVDGYGNRAE